MVSIFPCAYWPLLYLFGEMPVQVCHPFCRWIVKTSLHILDVRPLSSMWFASIFSYVVGCIFTILTMPSGAKKEKKKVLVFLKSKLPIFLWWFMRRWRIYELALKFKSLIYTVKSSLFCMWLSFCSGTIC